MYSSFSTVKISLIWCFLLVFLPLRFEYWSLQHIFFYVKLVYWNLMVRMNLAIRWIFEPFIFAYAGVRARSTISITNLHTKFISRDVSAYLFIIAILRVLNLNICDVFFVLMKFQNSSCNDVYGFFLLMWTSVLAWNNLCLVFNLRDTIKCKTEQNCC